MDWNIRRRGRVTYYTKKTNELFSDLVVEELDNGDQKLYFVGMTGALAGTTELGLSDVARMDPEREIPRVFDTWERYVRQAGVCQSLAELDFLEVHAFGAAPKTPNPMADPYGFLAEKKRIRRAYSQAYAKYWKTKMPGNGLPVRFTVYLEELPDAEASYEFGATALHQRQR
ncbi:MAG: hypothetical protein FJY95_16975 [Candidatus Handelsmanbacteria bacterium]|nr:hypothetical protein [Candidatus Handelsmanbacteria bacterium]